MSAGETLLQDDGDPESMQMAGEVNDDGGYLEVGDELDGGYDAPRRKATWQTTSATVVSNSTIRTGSQKVGGLQHVMQQTEPRE